MIENEIAKLENPDQLRWRSWLYPSFASCCSSSVSSTTGAESCESGIVYPFRNGTGCREARPVVIASSIATRKLV